MKRRSFLKWIGAAIAVPFVPKVAAKPMEPKRNMGIVYIPPKYAGSIYAQLKEKKGWKPVSEYGRERERMIGEFGSFGNVRLIQKSM